MNEITDLLNRVRKAGWRVKDNGSCIKLYSPDGRSSVTAHHSNSDRRAMRNLRSDLRKAGFK